jgi:uncharacterized membrane protein YsdA (DUF1294 family)
MLFNILLAYLLLVNAAGFLLMLVDKQKAKKGAWRIKERTLFLTAAVGGSIGSLLGMYTFRHKTKHLSFVLGMPAILIAQIALVILVILHY